MSRTTLHLAENPVRAARNSLHKTLSGASEGAGIHWQVWYLTECGCYGEIPVRIKEYLEKRLPGLCDTIIGEYRTYQRETRQSFGNYLWENGTVELPDFSLREQPFLTFRNKVGVSRAYLAKRICVQPAVLYKLESGGARSLPEQLVLGLKESGLQVAIIEELQNRTEEYYEATH